MTGVDKSKGQRDRVLTIEDEKNRVLPLRQMELIPPSVGIFDEPTRCYEINEEWAKIVMGMVGWLAEVAVWRDATNEGYRAIEEILRFKVGDNCMKFELRQNPTNACLIEQSLDGGETWITAFDLSLCTSIVDGTSQVSIDILENIQLTNLNNQYNDYIENYFQDIYNNYVNNYVDSPDDVYPDLAYGGANESELNAAYCNAVYTLVKASAEVGVKGVQEYDELQDQLNQGIQIAGALLTIIAVAAALPTAGASLAALASVTTTWGAAIGIAAVIGNDLVNEWQGKQISQYQDESAIFEVTCYIVDNIPGDTYANAPLAPLLASHNLTGNAAVIADNLRILLLSTATQAAFLDKWHNNLEFAEAGIELFCPCDDTLYCYLFDFTVDEQGWENVLETNIAGGTEPRGTHTANGWTNSIGDGQNSIVIYTDAEFQVNVLQIRAMYSKVAFGPQLFRIGLQESQSTVTYFISENMPNGELVNEEIVDQNDATKQYVRTQINAPGGFAEGSVTLHWVEVTSSVEVPAWSEYECP